MELWGKLVSVDGNKVTLAAENPEELASLSLYTQKDNPEAAISIPDGRRISTVQRKKAYAILGDMSKWSGYTPIEQKDWMKFLFEQGTGIEDISLGKTDMTTARFFITFLLDYALKHSIPLSKPGLAYHDDLDAYMFQCLKYRKCVVCGDTAQVHHIDAVGNNDKRSLTDHRKKRLIALCWRHHGQAHKQGWKDFSEEYHLKGIYLDAQTLINLKIMTRERMDEIDDKQRRAYRPSN